MLYGAKPGTRTHHQKRKEAGKMALGIIILFILLIGITITKATPEPTPLDPAPKTKTTTGAGDSMPKNKGHRREDSTTANDTTGPAKNFSPGAWKVTHKNKRSSGKICTGGQRWDSKGRRHTFISVYVLIFIRVYRQSF